MRSPEPGVRGQTRMPKAASKSGGSGASLTTAMAPFAIACAANWRPSAFAPGKQRTKILAQLFVNRTQARGSPSKLPALVSTTATGLRRELQRVSLRSATLNLWKKLFKTLQLYLVSKICVSEKNAPPRGIGRRRAWEVLRRDSTRPDRELFEAWVPVALAQLWK